MKASRATHRADFVRPGASFTLRRLPKALVLGIVAIVAVVLGSAGLIAPAKAAVAWSPPVSIATAATTPGNGVLRITPVIVSAEPYTLSPNITGGATFAGGATSIPVEIVGDATIKVPYTCTASDGYISLGFGFKGSPILGAEALCGAIAPVSVWVQQANIVLSAPGSGSASVALITTGSNAAGVFVAYVNGQEWSRFTVAAAATSTQPLTGLPLGSTLEIYGVQDGTASAVSTLLATAFVPVALPDPGLPISYTGGTWDGAGNGTLYPVGKFTTPDSVYLLVYQNGERFSVAGPIAVDGTKPVVANVNYPDCGAYDVSFSTAADLSGAIRWATRVEQAPCLVDDGDAKKIQFCHATGKDDKYVKLETSVKAFFQAGHNTHQDGRDIVPSGNSYTVKGNVTPIAAQNWDAAGQAMFENDCEEPEVVVPPNDDHMSKPIGVCLAVGTDGKTYEKGMLRIATILAKVGDNFGQHIIPSFDYPRKGMEGHFPGQNWTAENQVLFANDCKPAAVIPPTTPVTPTEPVIPVTPVVPETPTSPVAPQQMTSTERPNLTFETAAVEPVQQNNPWGAIALFATAAAITIAAVRRRWMAL